MKRAFDPYGLQRAVEGLKYWIIGRTVSCPKASQLLVWHVLATFIIHIRTVLLQFKRTVSYCKKVLHTMNENL